MALPRSPSRNLARIAKAANPVKILTAHVVKRAVFRAINRRGASLKAAAKAAVKAKKGKGKGKSTSSGSGPRTRTVKVGTKAPPSPGGPVKTRTATVSVVKSKNRGSSGKVWNPARHAAKLITTKQKPGPRIIVP